MVARKRYSRRTTRSAGRSWRSAGRGSYRSPAVRRSSRSAARSVRPQRVEIVMHHNYSGTQAMGLATPGVPGTIGVSAQGNAPGKRTF